MTIFNGAWTGQYDSAGKEIKEGDIIETQLFGNSVKKEPKRYRVVYYLPTASFLMEESEGKFYSLCKTEGIERFVV